jgi:hypothetical protein
VTRGDRVALGGAVAAILAGSWRPDPEAASFDRETLAAITPLLIRSGAAALAWRRVAPAADDAPEALELKRQALVQRVHARTLERDLEEIVGTLRAGGVEPVVVKGWAAARLYPERGSRPYGDVDLFVRPAERARAEETLEHAGRIDVDFDHEEANGTGAHAIDRLFERSCEVPLGAVRVRVLCPEDHVRLVCHHAMRSYLWRPLWLCDAAVAIESRPRGFDWDLCLGGDRRAADWVAHTIGLACVLLGVSPDGLPIPRGARRPPRWLVRSVLDLWGAGLEKNHDPTTRSTTPMRELLSNRSALIAGLRERWPTPLETVIDAGRPIPRNGGRLRLAMSIAVRGARFAASRGLTRPS